MVTIDNSAVNNFLIHLSSSLKNPSRYLKAAVSVIGYKDVIDHFKMKKGPSGSWAPRKVTKNVTIKAGPRKGESISKPLLENTGNLRGNFSPSHIHEIDPQSVKLFNPVPYSGYQDRGTKHIPSRKFMWFSNDAMEKMANYFLEMVMG